MTNNIKFRDTRLFDALEYVDERFIAEVTDKYEITNIPGEYRPNKRRVRKAYAVALMRAACVILLIGLVTVLPQIIKNIVNPTTSAVVEDPLTEDDLKILNEFFANPTNSTYVWAKTVDEAMASDEYRGKYGDCLVVFYETQSMVFKSWIVGHYRFATIDSYAVLREGKTYTLLYAYEYGWLSDQQIAWIFHYKASNKDPETVFEHNIEDSDYICQTSVPVALSSDEINEIVHAYFKMRCGLWASYQNDTEYTLRCFGKYGDVYAVIVDEPDYYYGYENEERTYEVNGVEFSSPYRGDIRIYKNGKFYYYVKDAFEDGAITQEQLEQIARDFNENIALHPPKDYVSHYNTPSDFELCKITVAIMPYADASKYKPSDFADIGCVSVELLSEEITLSEERGIKVKQLELTISSQKHQDLKDAVESLRLRSDIYSAVLNRLELMEEKDFISAHIGDSYEYYGMYGNCYIRYSGTGDGVAQREKVGNYTFEYQSGAGIEVYYVDKFYSLSEAYEKGYVSDIDLSDIYKYHTGAKYIKIKVAENKLFKHRLRLIAYTFAQSKGEEYSDKVYTVHLVDRIEDEELYAAFIEYEGEEITPGEWSENIHGREYKYSDSRRMYIISGENVLTLTEAESIFGPMHHIWRNYNYFLDLVFNFNQ